MNTETLITATGKLEYRLLSPRGFRCCYTCLEVTYTRRHRHHDICEKCYRRKKK